MAQYVQLGEVRTWYDEHGDGDPLVLLHGGLVDARFFEPNLAPLAERFHVYTPERRGHGHTPDVDGPITYQLMADDTIAFLDAVVGGPADLVGHSDGAFVAMLVAMQRPELVKRLVMISGGFDKSGEAAPDMEFDVDQVVQFLGEAYGEVSPDGEAHFPVVAAKIGEMMKKEPHVDPARLATITAPVAGDVRRRRPDDPPARRRHVRRPAGRRTGDRAGDLALPHPGEAPPGQRDRDGLPDQRAGRHRRPDPAGCSTPVIR